MTSGGWAAARLWRSVRADARSGWRDLPPDARRRAWLVPVGGALLLVVLTVLLVLVARRVHAGGALDWEPGAVEGLLGVGWFSFSGAVWFQALGTDLFLGGIVVVGAILALRAHRPLTALALVLSFVGVDLAVRLGWSLWARPRPDLVFGGEAAPGFHSFPSGHTAKTIAVWGMLAALWIRASASVVERAAVVLLMIPIFVAVPLARMRMGAHWPSDLVGGAVLGLFWLAVLVVLLRQETPPAAAESRDHAARAAA